MNVNDRAEYLTLEPKKCPHCEGIIGLTSDNVLFIGAIRHRRLVTMECGYCGKNIRWEPKKDLNTNIK